MSRRPGDWKLAVPWWGFVLSLVFCAFGRSDEKEVELKAIPVNVQWNGYEEVPVKLMVRVDSERIGTYCIHWMDGERSCREVDEQRYTEYLVHRYKTCVYDGNPGGRPIEKIVVMFGGFVDGEEKRMLRAETRIQFIGCGN